MNMLLRKKETYWFILILIVALASVRLYLANYLPIVGDGTFHSVIAEEIVKFGYPSSTLSRFLTDSREGYPLTYTQFFHVSLAIVKIFTGTYKIFTPILGIITVILFYLIGRDIFNSKIFGLISAFIVCSYPQFILYTSTVFMESLVVLFFFLSIYTHYKAITQESRSYLALCGLFVGAAFATKASMLFLPIVILLQHLYLKGRIKHFMYIMLISLFVILPFSLYLYESTGIVLFPTGNSLIDNIFPPRYIFQENAAAIMQSVLANREIYSVNYFEPHTVFTFFNPSTYSYNWYHMEEQLFFVFLLFGIFNFCTKENRRNLVWLMTPILVYYPILQITKLTRYFLPIKLIGVFVVASSLFFVLHINKQNKKQFHKYLVVIFITVLVMAFSNAFVFGVSDTKNKANTLIWQPTKGTMYDAIEAFNYIDSSTENGTLASSDIYSSLYYTNQNIIWINWYGNAEFYKPLLENDMENISAQFYKNNVSNLIIFTNEVRPRKKMSHPNQFPIETYNSIKINPNFDLVFKKGEVEVYKFVK